MHGLQGEMGASVMRYPLQYSALHQVVRRILLDSSDASGASSDERRTRVAPPGPSSIRTTPQILPNARDFQNLLGLWDTGVQRTGEDGGKGRLTHLLRCARGINGRVEKSKVTQCMHVNNTKSISEA